MKIKNLIYLFLLIIILFTSLTIEEESKNKNAKKEEKNNTQDDLDDDDDYDLDDSDNENDTPSRDMFENEKFEQKIHSICEKFNIKKGSKITKAQLKEVFIYLFKEEQMKRQKESPHEKEDKYELVDTLLNEAFNRLTYDLEEEDMTYDNIKNILSLDKASKIMLDIYTQMMPEMFDDEL